MTDDLAEFYVHATTVERYEGTGAYGDVFADPATVLGFVDDSNKLIRDSTGQQVVSSARVFFPSATDLIPLKSRVTLPAPFLGRQSTVIALSVHNSGGLELPDHLETALL